MIKAAGGAVKYAYVLRNKDKDENRFLMKKMLARKEKSKIFNVLKETNYH